MRSPIAVFCMASALAILSLAPSAPGQNQAPTSDRVMAPRVIRSVSGSKGMTQGTHFLMEDPRTVFQVPGDRQVIVAFEWEGTTGLHHLVGSWRNPEGKIVSTAELDYNATTSQFSCFWSLTFPDDVTAGLWALEVQMDNQPAGIHTFQILRSVSSVPAAPSIPTQADIYRRAVAASAFIDNLDTKGEVVRRGAGFFIADDMLVTAFQTIDGASSLRINLAADSQIAASRVIAWNRWQDWAVIKTDPQKTINPLEIAPPDTWKVGEVYYTLGVSADGARTIENVALTGTIQSPRSGPRMHISWDGGDRTIGSPLLDSLGRTIGIIGGAQTPGLQSVRRGIATKPVSMQSLQQQESSSELLVVPISLLPQAMASLKPVTLDDIAAQGQFVMPLAKDTQVERATLCKDFEQISSVMISPVNASDEFSQGKDKKIAIVTTWFPDKKVKTVYQLQIYDVDNHELAETPLQKISLNVRDTLYTAERLSMTVLPHGMYRIDLVLGGEVQWRSFFRVVE